MIRKSRIKDAPTSSGVYRFLNSRGEVVYVGKAKNLAARLSYYTNGGLLTEKTASLIRETEGVDWIKTDSEIESLILEAALIKKLRPRYNISLKDGKSYAYLLIAKTHKKSSDGGYPRVLLVRKKVPGAGTYFGPFPDGYSIKSVLRSTRHVFPYRDCSSSKFLRYRKLGRSCLLFDLKLCRAPCVIGKLTTGEYARDLRALRAFFGGKVEGYLVKLSGKMQQESEKLNFEKASEYRDLIERFRSVTQRRIGAESYMENPNLYEDLRMAELSDLESLLKPYYPSISLTESGTRIEAFDVSNLGLSHPVGAMVSFRDGEPEKNHYRRFKIKTVAGVNDPSMMREIIHRRLNNKTIPYPSLILIDGGKSQLSAVKDLLDGKGVPFVGLAKRWERVVVGGRYLRLPETRPSVKLLIRIRDETHRFAIRYQRWARRLSGLKRNAKIGL